MEKLLKKYKSQLATLKENKKQASKDKKYPYEVAIEIVEKWRKDNSMTSIIEKWRKDNR